MKNKKNFNYLVSETKNGKIVNLWADESRTDHMGDNIDHMPIFRIRKRYQTTEQNTNETIRTVLCIETDEIFPSISSAAKYFGASPYLIEQAIKHGNPISGCHLTYKSLADFINNK